MKNIAEILEHFGVKNHLLQEELEKLFKSQKAELLALLEEMQKYYEMLGTTGEFKSRLDAAIRKERGES
jgi:hypothetical protein